MTTGSLSLSILDHIPRRWVQLHAPLVKYEDNKTYHVLEPRWSDTTYQCEDQIS